MADEIMSTHEAKVQAYTRIIQDHMELEDLLLRRMRKDNFHRRNAIFSGINCLVALASLVVSALDGDGVSWLWWVLIIYVWTSIVLTSWVLPRRHKKRCPIKAWTLHLETCDWQATYALAQKALTGEE